ncbi:thiolase-like protein [Coniella lustricola]|uniref:Thiolase-like protein n=1 Tax=Coniella lustricola TaxID=2025994 RepID=A0A2T2ZZK5_9PEZI|nr:thiolase-like protein [Coniella lustricola]
MAYHYAVLLLHHIYWTPAPLRQKPLSFDKVVLLNTNTKVDRIYSIYGQQLAGIGIETYIIRNISEIDSILSFTTILVHVPQQPTAKSDIPATAEASYASLISAAQFIFKRDDFSGLFIKDQSFFPLHAIQYTQGFNVIKISNGVAHTAILQPIYNEPGATKQLQFVSSGSYIITGGTGGMGIEIAVWIVHRGARNLILISRSGLQTVTPKDEASVRRTDTLNTRISELKKLKQYNTAEIGHILGPKITSSLNLNALFPPKTLDFFILASSVGQLFGFPGQLSYSPANAFLDEMASYRRRQGDNATSIQWSSWYGVGIMAQSKAATRHILKGMHARGFEGISKEEAFLAWDILAHLNLDTVAVVRAAEIEIDEPPRHPILRDITLRRSQSKSNSYPKNAIAVIGMACRTAAGDTAEDLWRAIRDRSSMEREINEGRFPGKAQLKKTLYSNFITHTQSFNHSFFKKSKREAAALDPHQRILLETTYHTLKAAGLLGGNAPKEAETHKKSGKRQITGYFISINAPDYSINLAYHPASPYTGFGILRSFIAGRLMAIHQAYRAIQAGEYTQAVAGGVNLITNTVLFKALRAGGFLNDDRAYKTFDKNAGGYCRSKAVGVVMLKPLESALHDGDDIQGVLLATGNNQNLNYTSITNPVLESQVFLYKDVLSRAAVKAHNISYIEAHGTGTRAGDPVKVAGIRQVLGGYQRKTILHIGAVKPNIRHSEGASGVISLIKVLLMIKHDDLRLALVNSYSASGNNTAAIPIFISAASKSSLAKYCLSLGLKIENIPPKIVASLAFSLSTKQNRRLSHAFATTVSSYNGQNRNTVPSVRSLYNTSIVFRSHLQHCNEVIRSLSLPSLFPAALDGLEGESDLYLRHAIIFAIQYSSGIS